MRPARRALLPALLLLPLAAHAREGQETRLRLGASGEVRVAPDELAATLRVEVRTDNAAAAQERVNRRMAAALAAARATEGVTATTERFQTFTDPRTREVVAQQSLSLVATRREPALALVARLQADGLLLSGIGWRLSEGAARAARDQALREALRTVQERAAFIASELGMGVAAMTNLAVEAPPETRFLAQAMPAAPRAAADPTPPSVTAEDIPVSAHVTADFVLRR